MAKLKVSREARTDIQEIVRYTKQEWGKEQAERYVDGLEALFQKLVSSPNMGRPSKLPLSGLREMNYQSHIVFYLTDSKRINVARVLHSQMDAKKHFEK